MECSASIKKVPRTPNESTWKWKVVMSVDLSNIRSFVHQETVKAIREMLESHMGEDNAERRRQVLKCISGLDEDDRIIVSLKHMEGLSYREIAELMETSVSAIESRLFRVRKVLRKRLAAVLNMDSPES